MKRLALVLITPLLIAVPFLALARYAWAVITAPDRALRIAVGFDQLANVTGNGNEDETISSRASRARDEGRAWGCLLCWVLDKLESNHCNDAKGV